MGRPAHPLTIHPYPPSHGRVGYSYAGAEIESYPSVPAQPWAGGIFICGRSNRELSICTRPAMGGWDVHMRAAEIESHPSAPAQPWAGGMFICGRGNRELSIGTRPAMGGWDVHMRARKSRATHPVPAQPWAGGMFMCGRGNRKQWRTAPASQLSSWLAGYRRLRSKAAVMLDAGRRCGLDIPALTACAPRIGASSSAPDSGRDEHRSLYLRMEPKRPGGRSSGMNAMTRSEEG